MKAHSYTVGMFFVFAVIGLVSRSPLICAVISGGYSGWNSLSSGWWVLRADPNRARGRICCAFHVALAFWMGAPAALASSFLVVTVADWMGKPANEDDLTITLISLLVAILASCAIGFFAAIAAVWFRVKVWVHPRFYLAIGRELQQPAARFNCGTFVLATSVGLPTMAFACIFAVAPAGPWVLPLVFLGGPVLAIYLYGWLARRIFAASVLDYWQFPTSHSQ